MKINGFAQRQKSVPTFERVGKRKNYFKNSFRRLALIGGFSLLVLAGGIGEARGQGYERYGQSKEEKQKAEAERIKQQIETIKRWSSNPDSVRVLNAEFRERWEEIRTAKSAYDGAFVVFRLTVLEVMMNNLAPKLDLLEKQMMENGMPNFTILYEYLNFFLFQQRNRHIFDFFCTYLDLYAWFLEKKDSLDEDTLKVALDLKIKEDLKPKFEQMPKLIQKN